MTNLPSCLEFDEPNLVQQFKRIKICDEDEDQYETEEFSESGGVKAAIETHTDPQLATNRSSPNPKGPSGANSYTSMDTLRIQLPCQEDEKLLNMGMRLKKINKKESIKREADLKVFRHKLRKSLFCGE